MFIYSWNEHSEGAKALADQIGIKRIKHEGSKFKGKPERTVINWGSSKLPDEVKKCRVLNNPNVVSVCSDKLRFFRLITNLDVGPGVQVNLPDWTEDKEEALSWLVQGASVCARTILNGHSAAGLVLMEQADQLVSAPLYTKYVPKKHEFRVHVVDGKVIDVQRKAKKSDAENVNWKIRNLQNGFIYAREGFEVPDGVRDQALATVSAVGLDFGAVDIIWNQSQGKAFVLEVNTAPGVMRTTLENYSNALKGIA